MSKAYQPPCTVTAAMLSLVADIAERIGRLQNSPPASLRLRRANRIRTLQGTLAIEGNTLSEQQITAILEGKRVIAPAREIQEVRNASKVYEQLPQWQANSEQNLLSAHAMLMTDLLTSAGHYRAKAVGVIGDAGIVHIAPSANRVPALMADLFQWLQQTELHPLVASSIFHYEFEFIHPFEDGNGRMGRLWQSLVLIHWNPIFQELPIESMIFASQQDYYHALNKSTQAGDSAAFLEFMLQVILSTLDSRDQQAAPQATPPVTPQVNRDRVAQLDDPISTLKAVLSSDKNTVGMSRAELMATLKLSDKKSFRQRYLLPALQAGLIEMTIADKPNSRLQKYRLVKGGER